MRLFIHENTGLVSYKQLEDFLMANRATYKELEQRIRELEQAETEVERLKLALQESEELYRKLI